MAFGQTFLKNLLFGGVHLRDYTHASKTFRSNGYENAPRVKFLFHVYFTLNTSIPFNNNLVAYNNVPTIGLLVKNIQLPQYTVDTEVLNQYNRKRIIQKKITYNPIQIQFHDDAGDLIRTLWYNYYTYYYKDATQGYDQLASNGTLGVDSARPAGFSYNNRDTYAPDRVVNDWGYIGESYGDVFNAPSGKPAFFKDISIYGFEQHRFARYVLINPVINAWSHDTYDYEQGDGVMNNTVTIQYETVKYYSGTIGGVRPDTNVKGFADPNYYDIEPSPLGRPNGLFSVLGQGSILNTGIGSMADLQTGSAMNPIGAVQQSNVYYNTVTTNPINDQGTIVQQAAIEDIQQSVPGEVVYQPNGTDENAGLFFPTPQDEGIDQTTYIG